MRALLREPMVYFVALTALLFAASAFTPKGRRPGTLVVTKDRVAALSATFDRTWQRPPTEAEVRGLIDDFVREEVSAREAVALGLDRDDTVIRRRLRQKLEVISQGAAAQAEPSEEQLQRYFDAHAADYRTERGEIPTLSSQRDRVHHDWADAERRAASDEYYQALLARYTVIEEKE